MLLPVLPGQVFACLSRNGVPKPPYRDLLRIAVTAFETQRHSSLGFSREPVFSAGVPFFQPRVFRHVLAASSDFNKQKSQKPQNSVFCGLFAETKRQILFIPNANTQF
jgi:hypothetical protein